MTGIVQSYIYRTSVSVSVSDINTLEMKQVKMRMQLINPLDMGTDF